MAPPPPELDPPPELLPPLEDNPPEEEPMAPLLDAPMSLEDTPMSEDEVPMSLEDTPMSLEDTVMSLEESWDADEDPEPAWLLASTDEDPATELLLAAMLVPAAELDTRLLEPPDADTLVEEDARDDARLLPLPEEDEDEDAGVPEEELVLSSPPDWLVQPATNAMVNTPNRTTPTPLFRCNIVCSIQEGSVEVPHRGARTISGNGCAP